MKNSETKDSKTQALTTIPQPSIPTVLFIVGPTASGKSSLAIELAKRIGGEIICADSQTVRKHLDIGTAKPTQADQQLVKHHLLDIIEPYEKFSVADFVRLAEQAIKDIQARGLVPIVVGGSGLYIDALFFKYEFSHYNDASHLNSQSVEQLQAEIKRRNLPLPKNANNPRHLAGVLRRGPEHTKNRQKPRNNAVIIGLVWPDEILKARIANRVEAMFEGGFITEVEELIKNHGSPPTNLDAIGYPIAVSYLNGEISLDEAKKLFIRGDWQYARKQKAWFKRNQWIYWLNPDEQNTATVLNLLQRP